jgi:hypothetical protein
VQGSPNEPGAGEFSEDLITGFDHVIVIDFQIDRAGACKHGIRSTRESGPLYRL